MPSCPDFLFNMCVAKYFYNRVISPAEQEVAIQYAPLFKAPIMHLRQSLELKNLAIIQLTAPW